MPLMPFFSWCENSALGDAIRSSTWLFPVIESVHLLGLAVIGGAVLIVNMRLSGLLFQRQPAARIARDTQRWMIGSLLVLIMTGLLLFTAEATKCYYHTAFWMKMTCLLLAIVFTFTVERKLLMADEGRISPFWNKMAAVMSLLLWTGVGIGGRWIGFS